jgi:hypothetical protein
MYIFLLTKRALAASDILALVEDGVIPSADLVIEISKKFPVGTSISDLYAPVDVLYSTHEPCVVPSVESSNAEIYYPFAAFNFTIASALGNVPIIDIVALEEPLELPIEAIPPLPQVYVLFTHVPPPPES